MHAWKRRITGVALGAFAMNALTLSLAQPGYGANLNCTPKVFNTAAQAICTGTGRWRLRIDCRAQRDVVTRWVDQKGGTVKLEGECRFKARKATVEFS